MKKAWDWIKDNVWGVVAAVAGVFIAFLMWKNRSNAISSLDRAIQVRAAVKDIASKEARARLLHEQGDAGAAEVDQLKAEIAASKRRVMEINNEESLVGKTDDEVARLFTDAGF